MDDAKPANEPNEPGLNKIDLSQLQDFTFGTQWTEVKNVPGGPRRDRDDRRDRRDDTGGAPRDRRSFRRPAGAPAPGGPGGAPDQGFRERPPMGGGGGDRPRGEGFRGGPRRDFRGGGGGGERRDFRGGDRRDGPPMERGPYISPYFTMTCYPEDAGFAAMVKAVRASCRTFQLFEITKAVLEKNERFVVVIQRKHDRPERGPADKENAGEAAAPRAEKPAPIFMSVPDHLPFETEEAALHHVMSNHLGTFFSTEEVEIEPPKGNFPIINKCGITGELLGPPNYHRYQQILQQHHATRLGRMPFERFRESIQSVREPEVVQQWLDKMKKATRYTWIFGQKPAAPKPAATPAEAKPGDAVDAAAAVPSADAPAADAVAPAAEASVPVAEPAAPVATPAAETPAAAPAEASAKAGPSFDSFDEARAYLLAHAKEKAVRAVDNVRFHGRLIEKLPPGEIRRAVEGHVERQRRFPLDTANALRGRLRREGFTIFKKGSRGVSFVCAVKRRFRVPGQVFSESISTLIDFIEKHPLIHLKDLPKELLGIDVAAAAAAAAPTAEGQAGSQSPFAGLAPEQAEKIRKLTNDLRWLVTEGYVTEFSDGKLFAPPPMSPAAQKKADEHGEEHDPVDFPEAPAKAAEAAAAPAAEADGEAAASTEPAPVAESETPAPAEPEAKPEGTA